MSVISYETKTRRSAREWFTDSIHKQNGNQREGIFEQSANFWHFFLSTLEALQPNVSICPLLKGVASSINSSFSFQVFLLGINLWNRGIAPMKEKQLKVLLKVAFEKHKRRKNYGDKLRLSIDHVPKRRVTLIALSCGKLEELTLVEWSELSGDKKLLELVAVRAINNLLASLKMIRGLKN